MQAAVGDWQFFVHYDGLLLRRSLEIVHLDGLSKQSGVMK